MGDPTYKKNRFWWKKSKFSPPFLGFKLPCELRHTALRVILAFYVLNIRQKVTDIKESEKLRRKNEF